MRHIAALLLFSLLTFTARPAPAGEVTNLVLFEHGKLSIDRSKGIADITKAQMNGGFKADIGLGLYQSRMTTALEIKPTGSRLALTTRIKTEPVIYVAKEFAEGSCAYKLILGHEWQHYLYDRAVLRQLKNEVRGITDTVFATPQPTTQAALEAAKKVFFQQFSHAYEGLSFPLHANIDNPESYRQLATMCNGEINKQLSKKPGA